MSGVPLSASVRITDGATGSGEVANTYAELATRSEPHAKLTVSWKSKRTTEMSVPMITEHAVVKFLRMLSPYLMTAVDAHELAW